MKKQILLAVFLVLGMAFTAVAETRYVTDQFEVTFRSGPGNEYRILRMISTGQRLEVRETAGDWSRVAAPDGLEGWVRTQHLRSEPPARQALEATTARLRSVEADRDSRREENVRIQQLNQELEQDLRETKVRLEQAISDYEELRADSADFLRIRGEHEALTNQVAEQRERIHELERRLRDELLAAAIKWFLAGAGVLLLGMIIGHRTKKKRSSGLL